MDDDQIVIDLQSGNTVFQSVRTLTLCPDNRSAFPLKTFAEVISPVGHQLSQLHKDSVPDYNPIGSQVDNDYVAVAHHRCLETTGGGASL